MIEQALPGAEFSPEPGSENLVIPFPGNRVDSALDCAQMPENKQGNAVFKKKIRFELYQ